MKIAIVGGHHRTKMQAPFNDESWAIWSYSERNMAKLPRCDMWLEVHGLDLVGETYRCWLYTQNCLMLGAPSEDYPDAITYPLEDVKRTFGSHFLKNTASLASALAIMTRPDAIGWWGIEQDREYGELGGRYCVQHFVHLARALGIETAIPPSARIMDDDPVYALEPEAWAVWAKGESA